MSVTIEQAFKQVLEAAIHQVKHKTYEREPDNDAVEAFIEDLFAVLFPQQQPAQTVQTVTVPTVAATVTVAPAPEPEKPKRGRKPKAAAPAPAPEAAPEPEQTNEAPKKRGRKPKAATPPATEEEAAAPKTKNLEKLTATNKKHIKKWADEVGVAEPDTKALLAHVNAMSAEEFNGATFEQHVKSFLEPKQEEAEVDEEVEEVEFNGKTYWVNKETKRVYEQRGEAYVAVGYVGMAAFEGMKKN